MSYRHLHVILFALGVLLAGFAPASVRAQEVEGRLLYQLEVTQPNTRSQGWLGTLFSEDGTAIVAAPGAVVETKIGAFENMPCPYLWSICGFIRKGMLPVTEISDPTALLDDNTWIYRLFIHAEGSRSEGLTGVLLHGEDQVSPTGIRRVETPLGVFLAVNNDGQLWGNSGWFPETWN
ncbi:hypothetical protein [Phaeovulum sp.]|uniref:hypothetical protein n=1 Tax=Phaeovulum sp. TaxID=2934796 RepID=UPI00356839D1